MEEERDAIDRSVNGLQDMPTLPLETAAMNMIPEYFQALSIRLSNVLDHIGAGPSTVMERRETYLQRECMATITDLLKGNDLNYFHFGSQSEGTTIPGLNSDVDVLLSQNAVNIMTHWRDWECGMNNLLMLHDDIPFPQQYLLQNIRRLSAEPVITIIDDRAVRKDSGQILFSSERWKQESEQIFSERGEITKNGPSVSYAPNWDMVRALPVCKPLPEIQRWIDRCIGRHWPPAQLLEAAQVAPCFLVPSGHPDSDYKREEWRVSPNLIERMLMFSFNMTQIKCYIVLKLIKQTLFRKMVGDFVTSFHCKTLMFYTIERTHPSLWKEHNLMFLLVQCLQVLRKWLQIGRIPHYIIEGVNLFDGKVSLVQQRRLLQYVDFLIKNNLQDLFYIDIDQLGNQLQASGKRRIGRPRYGEHGPVCFPQRISLLLKFECLERFIVSLKSVINQKLRSNTTVQQGITYKLRTVFEFSKNVKLTTVPLDFINHLYALHNSVQLSRCLRQGNPAFHELIRRYKYSLSTDIASSRLKLASTLYCFGHLHAAMKVLEDVEKRYHSKVKAVCGYELKTGDRDPKVFANMISDKGNNVFSEPPFAFCVTFVRQEAHCAPFILWYDMHRNMTEAEVAQRNYLQKQWMDNAEVDAFPFFYYLQYLTYGGLGKREKQLHAMRMLESYLCDSKNQINLYHNATSLHLLGHCFEIEGNYRGAFYYYGESLRYWDTNNAANWHVQRVQRLIRS